MSEPRIYVSKSWRHQSFVAYCIGGCYKGLPIVISAHKTIAAAADAGRRHLAAFHAEGYSRRCGARVASRAATECVCAKSDADTVGGREKPAQRVSPDDLCDHCGATNGICEARAALQTTHNES